MLRTIDPLPEGVEVAVGTACEVEIEGFLKLARDVAVEVLGRRCLFRHVAFTLYSLCVATLTWPLFVHALGIIWTRRIVLTHCGKGNVHSRSCVKV